jgi:molybdenum-dependent DNA-binding transcriptional regulator ModE
MQSGESGVETTCKRILLLKGLSHISSGPVSESRRAGQQRSAFWRAQGFLNMVLAREAKAAKRQEAQARAAEGELRRYREKVAARSPPSSRAYFADD